ncbi:D-aminoacyl-tRNA deacylase [Sedimenticola selenatireducens]|uniref:D-aminoacyl-tRNA deacylase n=1 Tax=Sedimenticola selenatireducens TaxID=191960 RepID=A0A558DNY5_9GAMM|nr:D-aminoacyl-tRNA deacylase [Sedimenticola selenatireducens]TVO78421.1 D-tyrosyl-tRNA(Tyr) deacylase [Sedimenticola selenatireducens]TVT62721.1 MAG: D-tyrosyl-tRNA(Tyr) deacylase [Sedimenticola selenatireducens]
MIGLLQRVSSASVDISGQRVAEINQGLLVLVGVEREDSTQKSDRLLERLLGYRVFPDADDRMNLSLRDIQGGLLLVPQFTLAADTHKGTRPGFSSAATQEEGARLFDYLCQQAITLYDKVSTGQFGADMQVSLINDGPVTFWLQV